MVGRYIQIQNEIIKKYRIDICDGTKCEDGDWSRTHAHPKKRRVCKWKQVNSVESLFILLHEVGHIENNHGKMRRCEEEFHATAWAIAIMREYGLVDMISDKVRRLHQNYIFMELDRGCRRGGTNYPTREELTLVW